MSMEQYDVINEQAVARMGMSQEQVLESRRKYGENTLSKKK